MTDSPDDLDPPAFRAFLRSLEAGPESLAETRTRLDARGVAAPLPPGCEVERVEVGPVAAERLTPAGAVPGRLLIYLHGGGYQLGSPRSVRAFAARLGQAAAAPAIVPDYRLAPEHPFPAAVEDALSAYRWALERLPPERLAFAGDSAGAGLALAAVLAARAERLPMPAALYLISPWTDLAGDGSTYVLKAESDIFCSFSGLTRMAADYLAGAAPREPLASPVFADLTGLPPLLIHVGSEEILLSDSTRLAERAAAAKVAVRLETFPEMLHGFPLFHEQLAAARRAIEEAGAWLGERLGRG